MSIGVASFALIVVLSAFNGLEKVIATMNNRLIPDVQVSPLKGKTIDLNTFPMEQLRAVSGVEIVVPTITEDALFRANEKQHIGQVKGVGSDYEKIGRLNEVMLNENRFMLHDGSAGLAVPGAGVAWYLGMNAYNPYSMVRVYVPKRGNASRMDLEHSFNSGVLTVQSVFSTEQEADEQLVYVPFDWLSELLEYEGKASNVELFLSPDADANKVKKEVLSLLGERFSVKNQQEQQATLYRVMRSEKWAVYAILSFILILSTFNVVGSLSMLIIDKRKDTAVLKSMGADNRLIRKIFMNEGLLISVAGGLLGLVLGMVLVLLQQRFGFVKFGAGSGNYVVDAYPVLLKIKDVLLIFATILAVGCTSSFLTVRHAASRSDWSR